MKLKIRLRGSSPGLRASRPSISSLLKKQEAAQVPSIVANKERGDSQSIQQNAGLQDRNNNNNSTVKYSIDLGSSMTKRFLLNKQKQTGTMKSNT